MPALCKHTSFGAKVWGKGDSGVTRVMPHWQLVQGCKVMRGSPYAAGAAACSARNSISRMISP
jgi:hypothetical protein